MKTYLINLDKRRDRLIDANAELFMAGFKYERFPAIEHKCGRIGLILSMKKLFEENVDEDKILVFEDDVKFLVPDAAAKLELAIAELPPDFDMLYLGANVQLLDSPNEYLYIQRVFSAVTTHAVVYSNAAIKKVLEMIRIFYNNVHLQDDLHTKRSIDMVLNEYIVLEKRCYICKEFLATQAPSFSDIENRYVDYRFFLEERFKKAKRL